MRPLVLRGQVWGVVRVSPGDPFLVDRTGVPRLATTDPIGKVIRISTQVPLRMFDQVYIHEATHALMVEAGINDQLSDVTDEWQQIWLEETLAWFMERHGIEVINAVSDSLGRKACVDGTCIGR